LHWSIEKTREVIHDTLHDYGTIEWKQTLSSMEKAPDVAYQDVAYQDVLNEFN
jgi:hypothetical protein